MSYPKADQSLYKDLFARIQSAEANPEFVVEYLDSLRIRQESAKAAFHLLDVAEGKRKPETVRETATALIELGSVADQELKEEEEFVSDDLEIIFQNTIKEPGLRWRLKSLNRSLGPLRKGDFGYLFARPETGKTTFLASEISYMAGQAEAPILWFNNEERGDKVLLRCYEAALGAPLDKIKANLERARTTYYERTKRLIKLVDSASIERRFVERMVERIKPSLIVFDQLDKIKGFDADRDDLVLGELYQWARELAKGYAPVIGVCQASGEAEGIKYLHLGHAANAKTSKQAEADWILGIGSDYKDQANVRGFSICKNKLIGGDETIPDMRHGKWEVLIAPEIARYVDTASD